MREKITRKKERGKRLLEREREGNLVGSGMNLMMETVVRQGSDNDEENGENLREKM